MKTITSQQDGSPNQRIPKLDKIIELDRMVMDVRDDFRRGVKRPCRVPVKVWKYMLLNNQDFIVIEGKNMRLKAVSLGVGVLNLTIKELK
jgi:hypothetical protein